MRKLVLTALLLAACQTAPPPPLAPRSLFRGVRYERVVTDQPRPLVIHVVRIDLSAPGLDFLVTPPSADPKRQLRAQTTSQFLKKNRLQLAINGGFFRPFYAAWPFGFFPHSGDGVDVRGIMISSGRAYSQAQRGFASLSLAKTSTGSFRAAIGAPIQGAEQAISGYPKLITKGVVEDSMGNYASPSSPEPRTAVGLDRDAGALFLVVVDGRQRGRSEGMTLKELARWMRARGVFEAVNLDGGGSSTLVIARPEGARVLNRPIHYGDPGRERPVGNHLGVLASPSSEQPKASSQRRDRDEPSAPKPAED